MSDVISTLTESELSNQIAELVMKEEETGGYLTVRRAAKLLNIKQTEVKDNLPHLAALIPSQNGTLGESRIQLNALQEGDIDNIYVQDVAVPTTEVVQKMLPKKERRQKVETEKVAKPKKVKEPVYQLDEDGNQVLDEEGNPILVEEESGPTVICVVCGNPVRKSSIVRRGVCPLCFRTLARNARMNTPSLEALSDEEFEGILGEELGKRRSLEDYKTSRILTPEQYKEMEETLIPVKQVFAAAKEAGFGPGRVAQAMGGDRFRHEPLKGFGSVWTPYFYGPRKAWYFDKAILENFADLAKPVKEKKAKASAEGGEGEGAVGRKGARGAKMMPVEETEVNNAPAEAPAVDAEDIDITPEPAE